MKDLLLIIDMQNVFLKGEWGVPSMTRAEENILKLAERYPILAKTRHLSARDPIGTWARYNAQWGYLDEDPWNFELTERIGGLEGPVFEKYTYSAFSNPKLLDLSAQFDRVILTGVQTEFCVLSTMLDGVDRGIDLIFVPDACAGEKPYLEQAVQEIVERMPVQVACCQTDDLMRRIV